MHTYVTCFPLYHFPIHVPDNNHDSSNKLVQILQNIAREVNCTYYLFLKCGTKNVEDINICLFDFDTYVFQT